MIGREQIDSVQEIIGESMNEVAKDGTTGRPLFRQLAEELGVSGADFEHYVDVQTGLVIKELLAIPDIAPVDYVTARTKAAIAQAVYTTFLTAYSLPREGS